LKTKGTLKFLRDGFIAFHVRGYIFREVSGLLYKGFPFYGSYIQTVTIILGMFNEGVVSLGPSHYSPIAIIALYKV
jgi:hypothetical protein